MFFARELHVAARKSASLIFPEGMGFQYQAFHPPAYLRILPQPK
jgi:hypothetical protein